MITQDHQWELGGVTFGLDCRIGHLADSDPGSLSWRTQDQPNPIGDGTTMGRDLIEPQTWNFKLFTDEDDEEGALDALDELATIWRGDSVRGTAGKVMPLRYQLAGRIRRVYGRPRRWAAPLTNNLLNGYVDIVSDFKCVSELYFDDIEQSAMFDTTSAEPSGGFEVPFEAPIAVNIGDTKPQKRTVKIGGRVKTPISIDFHGPSVDASLEIAGQTYRLRGTLGINDVVTLDGRPWVMAATKDGRAAGQLVHPQTRLSRLQLPQGSHEGIYRAIDDTGASYATVRWHDAHVSP